MQIKFVLNLSMNEQKNHVYSFPLLNEKMELSSTQGVEFRYSEHIRRWICVPLHIIDELACFLVGHMCRFLL